MAQWFECKIRYDKTMEDGKIKKVTETYMVDALTFTEAEKRFLEEVGPYLSGDYEVSDIKKAKIAELIESVDGNDDRWYKAKVAFITLDEKTAVEKRTNQTMLILSLLNIVYCGQQFYATVWKQLIHGSANMDTLVAMGAWA